VQSIVYHSIHTRKEVNMDAQEILFEPIIMDSHNRMMWEDCQDVARGRLMDGTWFVICHGSKEGELVDVFNKPLDSQDLRNVELIFCCYPRCQKDPRVFGSWDETTWIALVEENNQLYLSLGREGVDVTKRRTYLTLHQLKARERRSR